MQDDPPTSKDFGFSEDMLKLGNGVVKTDREGRKQLGPPIERGS
jgi:hypothetical protein